MCRFLLTDSSARFMVLPTSVVNTGAKSHGWERKMPQESPRKLRSCSSLEVSLMKGLCEMRFWGDTTVSSSILPTPKSRKRAVTSEFVKSLLLEKSFLLFLFLFFFSGAPLFLVLRDRLSRIPGSPQTCYVAVHDLEIQSSCQYSPAFDFF